MGLSGGQRALYGQLNGRAEKHEGAILRPAGSGTFHCGNLRSEIGE